MTDKPIILLVDDDEDFLTTMSALIKSWDNAEVLEAIDGEKALAMVQHIEGIDLILCDYMMPEMDGLTFKEHLNDNPETKDIPLVMISGFGTPELMDMAAGRGIEEWYDKPVEIGVLEGILKKYLDV